MLKIVHLCLSLYDYWTTYEGEYLNESLMALPDVDFKAYGTGREIRNEDCSLSEVIAHLFGGSFPDVVIVHSSMEKVSPGFFHGLEELHKKCFVVWRTFDCFDKNIDFYVDQLSRYRPQLVLNWYEEQTQELKTKAPKGTKIAHFPHSVGRRYINKMMQRKFDMALIGRCENNGKSLDKSMFNGIGIYVPPKRETRPLKGGSLINDLNLCKFSWNSPVKGRMASLRFFEAPACGTLSMIPHKFNELDQYFPSDCYCICDSSTKKCSKIIQNMSNEEFLTKQQKAYKIAINNHSMDKRVNFLIDLINGKDAKFDDYYFIGV